MCGVGNPLAILEIAVVERHRIVDQVDQVDILAPRSQVTGDHLCERLVDGARTCTGCGDQNSGLSVGIFSRHRDIINQYSSRCQDKSAKVWPCPPIMWTKSSSNGTASALTSRFQAWQSSAESF